MHLTYLGNLLLVNLGCFSKAYVRLLEIVNGHLCMHRYVCVCETEGGSGCGGKRWQENF